MSRDRTRILVVEDAPLNMELFRDLLAAFGFEVLEATDATSGFQIASEEAPDAVVLDLQLPDMDGLVALSAMKADPRTRDIPTIVVTAHAMAVHAERAIEAGAAGFVTKPIDFDLLRSELERVVSQSAGGAS